MLPAAFYCSAPNAARIVKMLSEVSFYPSQCRKMLPVDLHANCIGTALLHDKDVYASPSEGVCMPCLLG